MICALQHFRPAFIVMEADGSRSSNQGGVQQSMRKWNRAHLASVGFEGFVRADALREDDSAVPLQRSGVYAVIRPPSFVARILAQSPAGQFKDRDPTISKEELDRRWLAAPHVLYFGKARYGSRNSGLRPRIRAYLRFGAGCRASHAGGRSIWQLESAGSLLFCWVVVPYRDPRLVESELLEDFRGDFGALPFANRRR
jgi:hypothetical protein